MARNPAAIVNPPVGRQLLVRVSTRCCSTELHDCAPNCTPNQTESATESSIARVEVNSLSVASLKLADEGLDFDINFVATNLTGFDQQAGEFS